MKLSIVTTLYKSAPYLMEFYAHLIIAIKEITNDYEIIFVNDGSPDNSLQMSQSIQSVDPKVSVVDLSRNFGHHRAIMTGLSFARGDYVFLIDCDLEEDPALLKVFMNEMQTSLDYDVIYGIQKKVRKGRFVEKLMGWIFYKVMNFLSDVKITKNLMVVRLMTQRYVKNMLRHNERELAFVGVAALTGFKQKAFPVEKIDKGSTTYSFSKKINLAINFITSLTSQPLVYIFYLGIFLTLLSFGSSIYLIFRKILLGDSLTGWASTIVSIWFFSGIIIFCLGIIGMYLSKIFIEVKQRPYTIIKSIYSSDTKLIDKGESS